ncbi:unnamed protein product [Linum tenue]|uniref:Uncharacterized protein n=1 Tax=Linum tenue TaxID=586396 RepID=A0AAV0IYZ2_9ROSI|nr:unnamed protein product [Linum tenue]
MVSWDNPGASVGASVTYGQISGANRREARRKGQAALLEYLHSTRSLQFMDADDISRNSPHFLEKILAKIDYSEKDIGRSITRFLRYHPINEFEPFFESLGLEPNVYSCILPEDMMFLSDDDLLMENYHVLCEYVIPRNKMGKILIEVPEVFRYEHGVLASKFKACEGAGINRSFIAKVIVSSPQFLTGNAIVDFVSLLQVLGKGGISLSWVEEHLPEKMCCPWSQVLSLVNLFVKIGYSEQQLCCLIIQHPDFLFEGDKTLSVIGFLSKFGTPMNQACSVFFECQVMEVGNFLSNLRQCFVFFTEIDMEPLEIGKIVHSQPLLLSSCALKKTSTLLSRLKCGKVTLCEVILNDPFQIKNWSKEVINMKIHFVVNELGYPISVLLMYPKFLVRTAQVIKLRLSMYDWLREQGLVARTLSFSTVLNSSEKLFARQYVTIHPRGPEFWKELKTKIYSS